MANEVKVITGNQIGAYLNSTNVMKFLEGILKERTGSFVSSMASIVSLDTNLQACTAKSLMMCGLKAASMNLPIDPNLGYAYPVPYNSKNLPDGVKEAQFQMGYKGYIQLAMRTGQYKKIVVTDIRAGEVKSIDPITETYEFVPIYDEATREKQPIAGYYAKFVLMNGFEKEVYWPMDKILNHGKRYSKSFHKSNGIWKTNEDSMCRKTVLRTLLSKWGPMSVEMQKAYEADMAVISVDDETLQEEIEYPDNGSEEPQDIAPEVKSPFEDGVEE